MIHYFRQLPVHAQVVAAGVLLPVALLLFFILAALGSWFMEQHSELRDLEPRIARMQGYAISEEQLGESVQTIRNRLLEVAYPATENSAAIGAAVQQQLRQHMELAGINISGSQLLSPRSHEGFEEIRVSFTGSGTMEALDQALVDLQQVSPLLFIREMSISPERERRSSGGQVAMLSMSISAIRLR